MNYKNSRTKIKIICSKHGEFIQTPAYHLKGSGCPVCQYSKGELLIRNYLDYHQVKFITQKKFTDCRNKKLLPFDFYLPDYNLCIEFQGQQHYKQCNWFGGKEKLEYIQLNDNIKRNFCLTHNIKLLEIPYSEKLPSNLISKTIKECDQHCKGASSAPHAPYKQLAW